MSLAHPVTLQVPIVCNSSTLLTFHSLISFSYSLSFPSSHFKQPRLVALHAQLEQLVKEERPAATYALVCNAELKPVIITYLFLFPLFFLQSAGRYTSTAGQYYCSACPPGSATQNITGLTSCTPCPQGSSASSAGVSSCSACARTLLVLVSFFSTCSPLSLCLLLTHPLLIAGTYSSAIGATTCSCMSHPTPIPKTAR